MMAHVSNKYMDDSDFEVELEEDEEVLNSQVCSFKLFYIFKKSNVVREYLFWL